MIKKQINSFRYAASGIWAAYKSERNLKIHSVFLLLVILAGVFFEISKIEWMICIILFGLVISLELVNTAIEGVVDVIMPERNPNAKFIKDVAAGAVLFSAICAAIIGLMIFVPKLLTLLG